MSNVSSSNSQEANVPKLRFPGFEGKWNEDYLKNVAVVNPKTSSIPRNFYYIDLESVEAGTLIKDCVVSSDEAPSRAQRVLQLNDILYQTVRPYQKNNYIFESEREIPTVASTGYAQVRTAENAYFFYELFHTPRFVTDVLLRCTGTSYPAINSSDLNDIKVAYPNHDEQQTIATFMQLLEKRINTQRLFVECLKSYKRGALSRLFPKNGSRVPEYRFSGFTSDWEQRKLGEVADIVGGGTPSTEISEYWDGDIDWYAPAEIADQIYVNSSQKKITELGYKNSSVKILPPGTVLFTSRAGIGKTAILARESCTNQGFQSIVPHENELDSYFIFSRTGELKHYAETVGAGSTFVEVSGKQMANMELMMPKTFGEQKKIGIFFSKLDNFITLHQKKVEQCINLKQSILEKIFI